MLYLLSAAILVLLTIIAYSRKANQLLQAEIAYKNRAYSELKLLKARIAGIVDRAYSVSKGEAYFNVQTASGKFSKIMLPYVDGK